MKKFIKTIAVALCLAMLVTTIPVTGTKTAQAASQKTLEKNAKKCLDSASRDCKTVMNTIYNSWYFQVYEADDYYNSAILEPYYEYTGIPTSKVKKIIKELYDETDGYGIAASIRVLSCNIHIVTTYFSQKGTYKKISKNLSNAKKYIKKLPNKKSKKKLLQNYYNAVNKYYKFVKSPSGSFSGLEDKRNSLDEKVDDCKEELSW